MFDGLQAGGYSPIRASFLWNILRALEDEGPAADPLRDLRFTELSAPLTLGWTGARGKALPPPKALADYLNHITPLVEDLAACNLLPVDLHWTPALPLLMKRLSSLLHGPDRCGIAMILDYGGTSRHVLDPRSLGPHLRVYGDASTPYRPSSVYSHPGRCDMTWDVDFTEIARLAEANRLEVGFYGHQSALEYRPIDLLSEPCLKRLTGTMERRLPDSRKAVLAALGMVARFREAPGYRMMVLKPRGMPPLERFPGTNDPLRLNDLSSLVPGISPTALRRSLAQAGVPRQAAVGLKPCGDPVADLSDLRLYRHRNTVLRALEAHGWLVRPGSLA
jgi:hypothetical protein